MSVILRVRDDDGNVTDIPAIRGYSAYQLAVKNGFTGTEAEWIASVQGVEGKSAYQVAVQNGFEGNEEAWLASLKVKGGKGDNGASAYQIAVQNGFEGNEEAWLASLKASGLNDTVKTYIDDKTSSTVVEMTITASTWGDTVTISNSAITATNNVVMIPGKDITATQLEALQKANCQDCGTQSAGSVTFKIFGTKPTISIPVRFIIGGNV